MTGRKLLIATSVACLTLATGGAFADTKSDQPVTDTVITTKVKAELAKDKATKATEIHVDTKDGVVNLNGAVGSLAEKEKAEADARAVKGVVAVTNNLRVASK
jgi:hyperosmotically inducible periplasmic protein